MMKKLVLTLGCLALIVMLTGAAMAAITFTYSVTSATVATIADESGEPSLTGGPVGGAVDVKDTNTANTLTLPSGATGMIQSDNNTSYLAGPLVLVASFTLAAA
jgi:hypothetical protein